MTKYKDIAERAQDILDMTYVPNEGRRWGKSLVVSNYISRQLSNKAITDESRIIEFFTPHIRTLVHADDMFDDMFMEMELYDFHIRHYFRPEEYNNHELRELIKINKQRELILGAMRHPNSGPHMIEMYHRVREAERRVYPPLIAPGFWADTMMYGFGAMLLGDEDSKKRPETTEKYTCLGAQALIKSECGKFTGELMNTNIRLWEESEEMRNCIYRSYRQKISNGKYLAYHVSAPHLGFKNGFTFGFNIEDKTEDYDVENNNYIISTVWKCDQIRGKANSRCDDRELQAFADDIAIILTKNNTRVETRMEIRR